MISIQIVKGEVIVTLPKAVLVMSRQEFIAALKRGKSWRRRQARARRQREGPYGLADAREA